MYQLHYMANHDSYTAVKPTCLCWSSIFSCWSSSEISSLSIVARSVNSWVLDPGPPPFHTMEFLLFFSISPMPSRTFVMSYILLFCRTASWSAAWKDDNHSYFLYKQMHINAKDFKEWIYFSGSHKYIFKTSISALSLYFWFKRITKSQDKVRYNWTEESATTV